MAATAVISPAEEQYLADFSRLFKGYGSLRAEAKIRLAMAILYDVNDAWDHDNIIAYPDDMPSFDEFLADIGHSLYSIRWK